MTTPELHIIHQHMQLQVLNHRHLDDDVYRDVKLGIKACRQAATGRDEILAHLP